MAECLPSMHEALSSFPSTALNQHADNMPGILAQIQAEGPEVQGHPQLHIGF